MSRVIKATPEIKAAVVDWYSRKVSLGTQPALAKKLGISPGYVEHILREHRRTVAQNGARFGTCEGAQES